MDLMSIRRGLMSQMGTLENQFFEVVHRFTATEDIVNYTFEHAGAGNYIFCEDPILTFEKAQDDRVNNALLSGSFTIYQTNNPTTLAIRGGTTLLYAADWGIVDCWGTYAVRNGDEVTIRSAGSNANIVTFRQGRTYVILKTKI